MLLYSIHVDITTILLIYWIVTLCVCWGGGCCNTWHLQHRWRVVWWSWGWWQ